MKYITKEDLVEIIQERLLDESLQLDDTILYGIETKAIAFVTSYISGRYDCDLIFAEPPLRHELLVQTIAMITCYRAVRRNAARKVPEDYLALNTEAIKILSNIQNGSQKLTPLPEIVGENGTSGSLMYGNTTNKNFFI